MSKSTPSRRSFGRRSSGTVTVIETRVHRSSARNARLAFILTAMVVGLLAATIAAEWWHPILAGLFGAAIGVVTGVVVWVLVRLWPVIRLLWWWLPEILLAFTVVYGWVALAAHTTLPVRLAAVAVIVGVPASVGPVRRWLIAWACCLIVRHRLRVCFAEFIISNQSGSLPLILWAHPTPVGERVWIYLRPGLSLADLESRLDKMAVACHASSVVVERASEGNAAYLRVDVKRREVLTATVGSPLVDMVDPTTPTGDKPPVTVPTALDLPDVPEAPGNGKPAPVATANGGTTKPAKPAMPATSATVNGTASGDDDISDWI